MLRHKHVVVGKENHPASNLWAAGKLNTLPDHFLSRSILRMSLACQNKLYGTIAINEDVEKPRRIVQKKVGPLVRRKATGKSQSQNIVVEYLCGLRKLFRRRSAPRELAGVDSADIVHESLSATRAELPKVGVAGAANIAFGLL